MIFMIKYFLAFGQLYLILPGFDRQLGSNLLFKIISFVIILSVTALYNYSSYEIIYYNREKFCFKETNHNIREHYSNTEHVCVARPQCLGMEISFSVYRMEKKKVVVGPSGLKEMKCTW